MNIDLFGNPVIEKYNLKSDFIIPPFSILDTASGDWQNRKEKWKSLGIKSEVGRESACIRMDSNKINIKTDAKYISIFDPVLCEIMYKWFVPKNGSILDPFAGGSVRGIVANYLDYNYTGIDLRDEQISSNMGQAMEIIPTNPPIYHVGDSNKTMNTIDRKYDFIFTCPPYYDLEVYSDYEGDLSNMTHEHFNNTYESIIKKSCLLLKDNRYACFVVGNVRDKHGYMRDLVGLTIRCFEKHGLKFYNDIILRQPVASASMRAKSNMKYKKIVKIHQNVLVFCKGNPKK